MRRLGSQYVLHAPLGRGASGEVWRGEREADGAPVAVKILRAELADDTDVVERFLRERKVLLGFDHPHLVKVRDLVAEGSTLAIVMDLVAGPDLRRYLRERDLLTPDAAVALISQVLDALATVHAAGVVHRDVKPENILVDTTDPARPRAMLTDFGIARLTRGPSMTRLTGLIGTPRYMAPELSEGTRATPAADLYSVGIVLYELLDGRPPFEAEPPIAMLRAHLEQTPAPLDRLPGTLWAVLARLLAKSPAGRPATVEHARAELAAALSGVGAEGDGTASTTTVTAAGGIPTTSETVISPRPDAPPLPPVGHPAPTTIQAPTAHAPTIIHAPAIIHAPTTGPAPELRQVPEPAGGASLGGAAGEVTGGSGRPGRRTRHRWMTWAGVGVAAAGVIGAGSWALAAAGGGPGPETPVAQARVIAASRITASPAPTATTAPTGTAAPIPTEPAAPAPAGPQPGEGAPAAGSADGQSTDGPEPVADRPAGEGLIAVPGVLNMILDDAAATLKGAGFSNIPYLYECYGSASSGNVVRQDPAAGTRLAPTAPVHLHLQAQNCATVPDVRGMSLDDAATSLRQLGFSNIPYLYECLGSPRIGAVVTQSPAPGTSLGSTQPVSLRLQANDC